MRTKNKKEKEDKEECVGGIVKGDFDRVGRVSRANGSEVKSSEELQ